MAVNDDQSSLEDPSLLDDNDELEAPNDEGLNNDDPEKKKKDAADKDLGPEDEIQVQLEEETEADVEARQRREEEPKPGDKLADDERGDGERKENTEAQYSKDVRARIGREQRIAREATARATAANQRALAAEAKSRTAQKEALEVTDAALDSQIKATRAALVKAKDDGKTEEEVKLTEDLGKLNNRREQIASAKTDLERQEEEAKRGSASDAAPNELAVQWKGRNKWYGDPRFIEQSAIVQIMDRKMKNVEGFDPNSSEYFEELDRRIRRRLPEMQRYMEQPRRQPNGDKGGDKGGERGQRREPTGGVRRASPAAGQDGARKGRVVTLTKSDQENMRNFGLDPKDPKQQREYALNKSQGGR